MTTDRSKEMVRIETDMGPIQMLVSKEVAAKLLEGRNAFAADIEKRKAACMRASELYHDQPTGEHRAALINAIGKRTAACNSHERAGIMLTLLRSVPTEVFWPVFMHIWPMCDASEPWNWIALALMRKHQPATEYMTPEIRKVTDALPDLIEVWRGADRSSVRRFSWTTDQKKAEFFAIHRRGMSFPNPVIAHAFIPKAHVFYADNGRNEAEVLLDPRRLRKLTVRSVAHNCARGAGSASSAGTMSERSSSA